MSEIRPQVLSVLEVAKGYASDVEIIFACEPVWPIGQVEPASAEYVTEVTKELRALCGGRKERKGLRSFMGEVLGEGLLRG